MESEHKQRAVRLLVNYFEAIGKKAGFTWDPDYTAEIALAVDDIVAAAVEELDARKSEHAQAVERMQHTVDQAIEKLSPIDPRD